MSNKSIAYQELRKRYPNGLIVINNYGNQTYEAVIILDKKRKIKASVTQCRGKIIRRMFPD